MKTKGVRPTSTILLGPLSLLSGLFFHLLSFLSSLLPFHNRHRMSNHREHQVLPPHFGNKGRHLLSGRVRLELRFPAFQLAEHFLILYPPSRPSLFLSSFPPSFPSFLLPFSSPPFLLPSLSSFLASFYLFPRNKRVLSFV